MVYAMREIFIGLRAVLATLTLTLFVTTTHAATEKVLYSFSGKKDGRHPDVALIFDAAGNLYGTVSAGGAYARGAVFELMPKTGGGWTEKLLFNFNGVDGGGPNGGLIFDASGNLYGTTVGGGANGNYGTVFELTPNADSGWTEKVLHSFSFGTDGSFPYGGLIFDASGNLYGTTSGGGDPDGEYGTVFELTPKAGGGWTEKVLHRFNSTDGEEPMAGLIFDASGSLYGTTVLGGVYGSGTVFELRPKIGVGWTEKVLHSFNYPNDGCFPYAGLTFDAVGNLYGTNSECGAHGVGTLFELTPKTGGGWACKILRSFMNNGKDGYFPYGGLIFDASGNLYGTTYSGGADGYGTVFELTPKAGGGWAGKILHSFINNGRDGEGPLASLIFDVSGNLYGTTYSGGADGYGTVFEINP
jgi:uncharacterized repeat protein (TIGR03803 family)